MGRDGGGDGGANPLGIRGIDHLEFACRDLGGDVGRDLSTMGFARRGRGPSSELFVQGRVRFLLDDGGGPDPHPARYLERHGEGVCAIGFRTGDAAAAHRTALGRGARSVRPPERRGDTVTARIALAGDIVGEFVERPEAALPPGLSDFGPDDRAAPLARGVGRIDHLTHNVPFGEMDEWAGFYKRVFGFKETRYFDIEGERTGLNSRVVQLEDNSTIIPINQPRERGGKDQIQEFLDAHNGIGVQHVALTSAGIVETVGELRGRGVRFLDVPRAYYEDIPGRERERGFRVREDARSLEENRILVDGDADGYLLQIFTKNYVGPLFYEFIQRRNHWGFGEGNFRSLFVAIERDQMERGYIGRPGGPGGRSECTS